MLLIYRLFRRRGYREQRATRFNAAHPPAPLRWRPRVRILGLVTGLVGGLGIVVLVAQYGIAPVTSRALSTRGAVGAIASGLVIPSVLRALVVWRFNHKLRRLDPGARRSDPPGQVAVARVGLLVLGLGLATMLIASARPVAAEVDGPCTAEFAGVDAAGRGTGSSSDAIEVPDDGIVTYSMSAPEDLATWRFWISYGPLEQVVASGRDEPDDPNDLGLGLDAADDFLAIDPEDLLHGVVVQGSSIRGAVEPSEFAWVGVGLYEVHGEVSTVGGTRCSGSVLIDVQGDPLTTALGAGAAGAAVIGLAGAGAVTVGGLREGGELIDALDRWDRDGSRADFEPDDLDHPLNTSPTVWYDAFEDWLSELERLNPDKTPQQLIARLHADQYGDDLDRTLPITGDRLFEHGPDTDGYEDVQLPTRHAPKSVLGPNGETLHIGHTYAGMRSDLNRGDYEWPPRDFMRWANTHGGDSWQEVMHAPESSWEQRAPGWASEYAPPDQRRGNTVGTWLSEFYRDPDNRDVPLSEAMHRVFRRLDLEPLDMEGAPRPTGDD